MQSGVRYISDVIKRSGSYQGLVEVLIEDLSHALGASVRVVDDKGLTMFHIELPDELSSDDSLSKVILPLIFSDIKSGSLEAYREKEFSADEVKHTELIASYLILILLGIENNRPQISSVKAAIGVLSYSELEAVIHVFNELEGLGGLLVASKIAEARALSRSAIVNGLRKLESAGLVETRSLGMKGTYIKILNDQLIIELDKFNTRR